MFHSMIGFKMMINEWFNCKFIELDEENIAYCKFLSSSNVVISNDLVFVLKMNLDFARFIFPCNVLVGG